MKNRSGRCRCGFRFVQDPSVGGHGHHLPGQKLAAALDGQPGGLFNTAAAGHLHPGDGDAPDVVFGDDPGELFGIIALVQLGTADEGDAVPDQLIVEIAVGIGRAVGGDQQVGSIKVGSVHRRQLDLHRPLAQPGADGSGGNAGGFPGDGPGLAAGTATGQGRGRGAGSALFFGLLSPAHRFGVIGGSLPLLKGDGAHRAGGQAVAQTVTIILAQQLCLAVFHADGTLMAGIGAQAAADAGVLVDFDDFSFHWSFLRVCVLDFSTILY